MKNFKKRDIAYIWICTIVFLVLVFVLSNTMYLYGSQLDWYSEHIAFPNYFRTLFYDTKDLLPDFAMNIGSGQNIYNMSYYGFLSPIILISYLFPFVSMTNYLIISTCLTVIISMILLYIFLKNKNFSSEVSFISSLLFIMSSSLTLHSHRHIMFITYMPFVIMGLFGVDKKLHEGKSSLLAISVFLMIMTNYYYSIGGICVLVIYGIYDYLKSTNKVTVKDFFKKGINYLLPILIGVLSSCIIILPTFVSLLSNRADSNITLTIKDILMPRMNTSYVLYDTYGVGLTAIVIFALISFIKKRKENIFLGLILSLFVIFPVFSYVLNGTMYIDSKALIPFLPLYIYVIANFVNDVFENKINYKVLIPVLLVVSFMAYLEGYKVLVYLFDVIVVLIAMVAYKLFNKKSVFIILVGIFSIVICYSMNASDTLVLKFTSKENVKEIRNAINEITDNDDSFYRISNNFDVSETVNNIYGNIDYYNSTIYSSISNQRYNKFYFDVMNNNIPSRNRALTVTTPNIMSLMLTNNKYIVGRVSGLQGYEQVKVDNGISIYKNEDVLPLGFATSNVSSYEDFEKYNYAAKQEALLNMIVGDVHTSNNFVSSTLVANLNYDEIFNNKNIVKNKDGSYEVDVKDKLKITYELPDNYKNKIMFIQFNMNHEQSCGQGDLSIKINNVKNKLTCKSWKYHNGNRVFNYVLAEKDLEKLTISFSKGHYNISNFEVYYMDYANIKNVARKVDKFNVDTKKTKGDIIEGDIDVSKDGYFMLTIPYDKGFKILVDGKKVDYVEVDYSFIGFKINEGKHHIKIEYQAPMKNVSLVISLIGIMAFIGISVLESKRKIK